MQNETQSKEEEDVIDPVIEAIAKTGCLELHYAVQECMYEHKDWRRCQQQVNSFRECIQKSQRIEAESGTTK